MAAWPLSLIRTCLAQITRAEASAEQGIVVELEGSKRVLAAAAVHVLLTR